MTADTDRPAGLVGSLRRLLAHGLTLFATRGELAALELADARDRAVRWLALGLVAAVLLLAALMTLSLWVAAFFWDGPRALALGLLAAAYAVAGVVAVSDRSPRGCGRATAAGADPGRTAEGSRHFARTPARSGR